MKTDCKYDLSGKRCIVTGASGALGESITASLLAAGAKVALTDINPNGAQAIIDNLDPGGDMTLLIPLDVTKENDVVEAVGLVEKKFGGVDILVNVAGITRHGPIDEMSLDDFQQVLDVNLTGTFLLSREVVRIMKKQKGGKIVNIASVGGETGRKGVGVNYAASKAGVVGLTKCLAREVGIHGIYVNAINPGPILTELTKQVPEEVFAVWNTGRAVEKNGLPQDVANAVLFLASGQSDWITGTTVDINGGIYM